MGGEQSIEDAFLCWSKYTLAVTTKQIKLIN